MPWTLCSKQDVVAIQSSMTPASLKDEWSDMVESLIREYMRAPYYGLSQAITDEYHNGDGSSVLIVKKAPIISVEALSVDGSAYQSSDYVVFPGYVELKGQTFPEGRLNVKISYTSGTTSVEGYVKICAATMIVAIINYNRRMGSDAGLKWAEPDNKVRTENPTNRYGLMSHLKAIMKQSLPRQRLRTA